jgi:Pentapeptide repeats (8 copies)
MKKMTAQEVIQRYHKGERDFRRLTLRRQSFYDQNLSGADFSEADIRGTNFTKANLSQTNFSRVNCGCTTKYLLIPNIIKIILGIALGYVCAISSLLITSMMWDKSNANIAFCFAGVGAVVLLITALISISKQGLITKVNSTTIATALTAISSIAISMVNVAIAIITPYKILTNFQFIVNIIILTVIGFFLVLEFIILVIAIFIVVAAAGFTSVTVFTIFSSIAAISDLIATPSPLLLPFNIIVSIFSIYITRQTHKGNEKFRLLQILRNNFGAIGGTSFVEANLTGANFEGALLESTDLRHANVSQVSWKDAKKLDFARWGESILANTKVRQLLIQHFPLM